MKHRAILVLVVFGAAALFGQATNLGYNPSGVGTHGCQSGTLGGTCYYIDYAGGNDNNSGLDEVHPWKAFPQMPCATPGSIAANHTPLSSDEYIGKGGVTWPASCYPWTNTTAKYIGLDPTWNAGIVNSVRVIDQGYCSSGATLSVSFSGGGGAGAIATANMETPDTIFSPTQLSFVTVTNQGSGYSSNPSVTLTVTAGSCSRMPVAYADIYSPVLSGAGSILGSASTTPIMIKFSGSGIDVDGLEFAHFKFYSNTDLTYSGAPTMMVSNGSGAQHLRNLYGHDYQMSNLAGAARGQVDTAQSAMLKLAANNGQTSTLDNSIFNNWESEAGGCANSYVPSNPSTNCVQGTGVFGTVNSSPITGVQMTNLVVNNFRGGLYTTGAANNNLVAGIKMFHILHDASTQHADNIYAQGGGLYYNIYIENSNPGAAAFYNEANGSGIPTINGLQNLLFNFVVDDIGTSTPPIGWTEEFTSISLACTTTNGSVTVTCNTAANAAIGMDVSGTTIDTSTTIANISGTTITLSKPAIASGTGINLNVHTSTGFTVNPDLRAYNITAYSYNGTTGCFSAGQWYGSSAWLSSLYSFTLANIYCVSDQTAGHWFSSDKSGTSGVCPNGCGKWNGLTDPNGAATQAAIDAVAVVQSPATATSQGYTAANRYAPTSSSSATVLAAGQNLSSLCGTTWNGLSLANLCYDILGNSRPSFGSWNDGAYQYGGGASSFTITMSCAGNGSFTDGTNTITCTSGVASPSAVIYPSGATPTFTATAGTGYTFTGWTGACGGTSPCSLTVTSDLSLGATFTANQPTCTLTSSPANVQYGDTITFGGTCANVTAMSIIAGNVLSPSLSCSGGVVTGSGIANAVGASSFTATASGTGGSASCSSSSINTITRTVSVAY